MKKITMNLRRKAMAFRLCRGSVTVKCLALQAESYMRFRRYESNWLNLCDYFLFYAKLWYRLKLIDLPLFPFYFLCSVVDFRSFFLGFSFRLSFSSSWNLHTSAYQLILLSQTGYKFPSGFNFLSERSDLYTRVPKRLRIVTCTPRDRGTYIRFETPGQLPLVRSYGTSSSEIEIAL